MIRIYECKNCGGRRVYKPGSNEMTCLNCGTTESVSTINVDMQNGKFSGKTAPETGDNSGDGKRTYKCPSCGADFETGEVLSATSCAYCGSPLLIESRLTEPYRPTRILPFKIDKASAQAAFRKWSKRGILTPAAFKSNAVMDQVQGTYVPFWLYDYDVHMEMTAEAVNRETKESGEGENKKQFETVETYNVYRETTATYREVPFDASENFPDEAMEVIEPFDSKEFVEFSMPYLPGFQAERYGVKADQLRDRVREELQKDMEEATEATITGYDDVTVRNVNATFTNERTEQVLLPVWSLHYTFRGKTYPLYMNGRSGKIDGALPTDKLKALIIFLIAFALGFGITMALGLIFAGAEGFFHQWYSWLIIGLLTGGLTFLVMWGKQSGPARYSRRHYMENGKVKVLNSNDRLMSTTTKER